jgi:TolB protein
MQGDQVGRRALARMAAVAVVGVVMLVGMPAAHATNPGENGRIAFRRYFNQQHTSGAIFTMNPDGSDVFRVTHPGPGILTTNPQWSPDGQWIVYYQNAKGQGQYDGPDRIYKIRADGTDRTYLSQTCTGNCFSDYGPVFSPDGAHIAFYRLTGACNAEGAPCLGALYIMRSNGTSVRRVTERHPHPPTTPGTRTGGPSTRPTAPGWCSNGGTARIATPSSS